LNSEDTSPLPDPKSGPRRDNPTLPARLWRWIDQRTGADQILHRSLYEPIPGGARFAYVFGSALLFIFVSQIITGICLALYYVPSPMTAHVSLAYIVKEVAAGSFLRSLHSYGSSAMIVVLLLHFLQTFLYGSYKGKRELLWISGCTLALLILGMAFTGYILRWDQKAYFAGSVGTNIAGQVPLIGEGLRRLLRGGATMGALTISRFYVLHVFVIPALIFLFIATHVFLFRKAGAAGPMHEDPVSPRLPAEMFYPNQVLIDMGFVLLVMGVLGMLAHFFPVMLGPAANPTDTRYLPRPEWFYLPMFQWLKYWEGWRTVIGIVIIPVILIALLFLLPFMDRGLERRPWRRPIPVGGVFIVLIGLLWLGMTSHLDDLSDPTIAAQLTQQSEQEAAYFHAPFRPYSASPSGGVAAVPLDAVAAHGKTIFDSHGCNGCHGESGIGAVGPALTHISSQFPPPQLTALLKAPTAKMKAGGMVPLTLNTADTTALVSYLTALGGTSASSAASAPASESSPLPPATSEAAAHSQTPSAPALAPAAASAPPKTRPGTPAASASAPVRNVSAQVTSGEKIYQSRACFACHGVAGIGTPRASALTVVGKQLSAVQITALLHNPTAKMKAGGMPPVTVSDPELASLVAYIKSLGSTGGTTARHAAAQPAKQPNAQPPRTPATVASEPAQPPSKPGPASRSRTSTSSPATTSASTSASSSPGSSDQRGAAIFNANGCAACHGLGGIGTARAPALTKFTKTVTPVALTTLLHHPTKKMTAGGMPPVNLAQTDMSALVAYLQNLGTPASAPLAAAAPSPSAPSAASSIASNPVAKIAPQPPMTKLESQGKLIFQAHRCADCHGTGGMGGTAAASALAGTGATFPPALLAQMLQHPTPPMQKGGMPPVSLGSPDLKALVAYVSYISASKSNFQ